MGMFDEVVFFCPHCNRKTTAQSKAFACNLNRYHYSSVPVAIAIDLNGQIEHCIACDKPFKIVTSIPDRVNMITVKFDKDDDIFNGEDYD